MLPLLLPPPLLLLLLLLLALQCTARALKSQLYCNTTHFRKYCCGPPMQC
jgi:hypothetical protein